MMWSLLAFLGTSGDKEYLLLGDYSCGQNETAAEYHSSSDEEGSSHRDCSDVEADDSGSSTDVDVVVQEYKERVQVDYKATNNFSWLCKTLQFQVAVNNFQTRTPTLTTSISVVISILLVVTSSVAVAFGIMLDLPAIGWSGLAGFPQKLSLHVRITSLYF